MCSADNTMFAPSTSRFSARLVGLMAGVVLAHAATFVFPGLQEANICSEPWPVFPVRLVPLVWDGPPVERNVSAEARYAVPLPEVDTLAVAHGKPWVATLALPDPVPGQVVNAAIRTLWMVVTEAPRNRVTHKPEGGFLKKGEYLAWFLPWVESQEWVRLTTTWGEPKDGLPLGIIEIPTSRCPQCGTWEWEAVGTLPYHDAHGKEDTMHIPFLVRVCPEGKGSLC